MMFSLAPDHIEEIALIAISRLQRETLNHHLHRSQKVTPHQQTHLDALIKASDAAWEAATGQDDSLGLDDPAWNAAADAELAYREEVGEDYATKFEDAYCAARRSVEGDY